MENGIDRLVRNLELKGDYYEYVEGEFAIIGCGMGKRYRIGDNERVKLVKSDKKLVQLTFELIRDVTNRNLIAKT